MLKQLKLTNFRKVRSDEMNFGHGINLIRGVNEASKTSRLEAITYALFGTKGLRTSLADTVTWGENEKTLKAELSVQVGADTYVFTRSKGGAEILKNGEVFVTGQTEVSNFAADLLGADLNIASKLMLAGQTSIQGALKEGPKALSVLIEDLAGFADYETILEKVNQKLMTGSSDVLQARLEQAQNAMPATPVAPDTVEHDKKLEMYEVVLKAAELELAEVITQAQAKEQVWREASHLYLTRVTYEADVKSLALKAKELEAEVTALEPKAAEVAPDLQHLKEKVAAAKDGDRVRAAWRAFDGLPPGPCFKGSKTEFADEYSAVFNATREAEEILRNMKTDLRLTQAGRINHDTCDKCGQDITHLKSVKETNAKVDAAVALLTENIPKQEQIVSELEAKANSLRAIEKYAQDFSQKLLKCLNYVSLDESVYPPTAFWSVAPAPKDDVDLHDLERELNQAEVKVKAIEGAKAKLEHVQFQIGKVAEQHASLEEVFAKVKAPTHAEYNEIVAEKDRLTAEYNRVQMNLTTLQMNLKVLHADFKQLAEEYEQALKQVAVQQGVVAQLQRDIADLAFNNALVRKLRTLRPIIASRLWNTLLASVSVMFSTLRGEESVVTKEASGFKVNGASVESLSGSTLDLLGTAIRVALVKTFVPQCSLFIADEIAAAMDINRTESVLGFLAGAGFSQVLLVTHDPISDSIADHIIELENV